jgi:hypothetical protein
MPAKSDTPSLQGRWSRCSGHDGFIESEQSYGLREHLTHSELHHLPASQTDPGSPEGCLKMALKRVTAFIPNFSQYAEIRI